MAAITGQVVSTFEPAFPDAGDWHCRQQLSDVRRGRLVGAPRGAVLAGALGGVSPEFGLAEMPGQLGTVGSTADRAEVDVDLGRATVGTAGVAVGLVVAHRQLLDR